MVRSLRLASKVLAFVAVTAQPAAAGPFLELGFPPEAVVEWAAAVVGLERGPQDLSDPESPLASFGDPENALDAATGDPADVVSLGDGGSILLGFAKAITDGEGADLVVFENGFFAPGGLFAELAFVEVSTDGERFARFPAVSLIAEPVGSFDPIDPTDVHAFAGKHRAGEGTGFDLAELADHPRVVAGDVDLSEIVFVRVVDVVGDGSRLDAEGRPVFDPFPTPFASGGFDLEAVGALHVVPEPRLALFTCLAVLSGAARRRTPKPRRRRAASCALLALALLAAPDARALTVDLEDLSLPPESFFDGSSGAGGFTSRGVFFNNEFTDFGGGVTAWRGFGYSNQTDTTTPGFENQFSAFPGGGAGGSEIFAVAFALDPDFATITLPEPQPVRSVMLANTTLTALSMRDGDAFAKQFGGPDGSDPDFYSVTITGRDAAGSATGSVEFFLADFRFEDDALDFILAEWSRVDLAPLGVVSALTFSVDSSDVGPFGINTPAFFALDDLVVVPEVSPAALLALGLGLAAAGRRLREPRA